MKYIIALFILVCSTFSYGQLNVELLSTLNYPTRGSDVWGYEAPDGSEYALLGTLAGVAIVDITDPRNPLEVDFVPQGNSIWRDLKTWGNYAYAVADQNGTTDGVLIMDLQYLPDSVSYRNVNPNIGVKSLQRCHNIYIDEFGIAYLAGCSAPNTQINQGGVLMYDVATTPGELTAVGVCPKIYSHDVYARDNILYSSEISEGVFTAYDVSDKSAVVTLGRQTTPFEFTHNTWLSDNGEVIFTTDERANASVAAYDISDLQNIKYLDEFRPQASLNTGVIPHNVHVWDDYLIISYYTDGCIIVDASRPDNLIEVGNFDTFTGTDIGFSGTWGAYPFFRSGNIILGDIQEGLVVLGPDYKRACYLEGQVTDAATGLPIQHAYLEIAAIEDSLQVNLDGHYKTGTVVPGSYEIVARAEGYKSATRVLALENGVLTNGDFQLGKYEASAATCVDINPNSFSIIWDSNVAVTDYDILIDGLVLETTDGTVYNFTNLSPMSTFEIIVQSNFEDCPPLLDTVICETSAYLDLDGDGYTEEVDCDDTNAVVFPGATEICDDIDNNCDGVIDEGLAFVSYFIDQDGDGFGDPSVVLSSCAEVVGYVIDNTDCDDADAMINPMAVEIVNNGVDENCDGMDLVSGTHDLGQAVLHIYPNPVSEILHIDLDDSIDIEVFLYDTEGKLVGQYSNVQTVNVQSLSEGSYVLKIYDPKSGQSVVDKITIVK